MKSLFKPWLKGARQIFRSRQCGPPGRRTIRLYRYLWLQGAPQIFRSRQCGPPAAAQSGYIAMQLSLVLARLPDTSALPRISRAGPPMIVVVFPVAEVNPRSSGESLPPRERLPRSCRGGTPQAHHRAARHPGAPCVAKPNRIGLYPAASSPGARHSGYLGTL